MKNSLNALAITILALLPTPSLAQSSEPIADQACVDLTLLLAQAESQYLGKEELQNAALEVDESCIARLRNGFDRTEIQRAHLADVLVVIGGSNSVGLLKALASQFPQDHLKYRLCAAMASTGSHADIRFLLDTLAADQPVPGDRSSINYAALALSILHPTGMLEEIQALASSDVSGDIHHLAQVLQEGELTTPQGGTLSMEDEVVLAVLRSSIPGTSKNTLMRDLARQRVYTRSGNKWYLKERKLSYAGDSTRTHIKVRLSSDKRRSIVDVGYRRSYTYIIRREAASWRVRGVLIGPET